MISDCILLLIWFVKKRNFCKEFRYLSIYFFLWSPLISFAKWKFIQTSCKIFEILNQLYIWNIHFHHHYDLISILVWCRWWNFFSLFLYLFFLFLKNQFRNWKFKNEFFPFDREYQITLLFINRRYGSLPLNIQCRLTGGGKNDVFLGQIFFLKYMSD